MQDNQSHLICSLAIFEITGIGIKGCVVNYQKRSAEKEGFL
jgi:hypothetical protein